MPLIAMRAEENGCRQRIRKYNKHSLDLVRRVHVWSVARRFFALGRPGKLWLGVSERVEIRQKTGPVDQHNAPGIARFAEANNFDSTTRILDDIR
jgi:hypothetical protein